MNLKEETVSSRLIFDGKVVHLYEDKVALPNGEPATREYVRHIGAVCVLALTDDNEIVLERQYRYPMERDVIEIPAGKLDSADEDPMEAALREPEKYRHLIVRVGGFSARFVDLSPVVQKELLARTLY